MDRQFLVDRAELTLRFTHPTGSRRLSFHQYQGSPAEWQRVCRDQLRALLAISTVEPGEVTAVRTQRVDGVEIQALIMQVDETLSIPAYLLQPAKPAMVEKAVMAIHGHGEVGPCIGLDDDYHHQFALELAQAGHRVLCPELRGFGALRDLAHGSAGRRLDYWTWEGGPMAYSLVTDGFLYGQTLVGQTVEDLLRWESWLHHAQGVEQVAVAGISYGGDLALMYPVFSNRITRIFASGTLGSFAAIYSRCYNAPAHCVPGILEWMDRADIAGLNAPRPLAIHYGELDTPSEKNYSASYNETVGDSLKELREIYRAFDAEGAVELTTTPNKGHEMDIEALLRFSR